jgi:hypothetical protein
VAILLQIGSPRQHGVGVDRHRFRRDVHHDLVPHVLQRATGEERVRDVAQRVHAHQEQDVDSPLRGRLKDRQAVRGRLGGEQRPPGHLDGGPIVLDGDRPPAGQERGVSPAFRAPRSLARRQARRTGPRRPRRTGARRPPLPLLGQHRPGQDDAPLPSRLERLERPRRRAVRFDPRRPAQERGLVAGQARDVLREIPQPRPPRVQHEHLRAATGRLADPEVQDRQLLFGVEPTTRMASARSTSS